MNFQFYDPSVHVTGVDFSSLMIDKARIEFHGASRHQQPGRKIRLRRFSGIAAKESAIPAEFFVGDIEDVDLPEGAFDAVVSTLSMCAYRNPATVLERLNRYCKDDGQILLMEHGKSSSWIVNSMLKLINPVHVRIIGCHANRDIGELLRQSQLQIVKHERYWFDMIHLIWATPTRQAFRNQ